MRLVLRKHLFFKKILFIVACAFSCDILVDDYITELTITKSSRYGFYVVRKWGRDDGGYRELLYLYTVFSLRELVDLIFYC